MLPFTGWPERGFNIPNSDAVLVLDRTNTVGRVTYKNATGPGVARSPGRGRALHLLERNSPNGRHGRLRTDLRDR